MIHLSTLKASNFGQLQTDDKEKQRENSNNSMPISVACSISIFKGELMPAKCWSTSICIHIIYMHLLVLFIFLKNPIAGLF